MKREEFKAQCEKGNAVLDSFEFTSDPKADLKTVNEGFKIVRVTRLVNRTRKVIAACVALLAGAGLIVGGIISRDTVMLVITIIAGAFMLCAGSMWLLSLRTAVTHRAICVLVGGKVQEFIYSGKGTFIYNTVEDELVCEHGKVAKSKHKYLDFEPSYPYVDFLDRDFSNYHKARTGEPYDGGEVYERNESANTITAYKDESKKKRKFTLYFDGNKPYKMDYLGRESYVYSRINDSTRKLYLPIEVKGKLTPPEYIDVEYVDFSKDYLRVWSEL